MASLRIIYEKVDGTLLKNYGPISFVNVDEKIIGKVTATKLS